MRLLLRSLPLVVASALSALSPGVARAQPAPVTARTRTRAAAIFDQAVARFNRAEYSEAARAFMEADAIAPSAIAITNAIAAARRASDHLLVARLAGRAIARGSAVVEAREALAEAATRLARLELSCDVDACALVVDGEAVNEGATAAAPAEPSGTSAYVLPGTHRVVARAAGVTAEERVVCVAGAAYRVALHPAREAPPAPPPPVARPPVVRPPVAPPDRRGLPRGIFFAGLGATVVLAGVTAWSGLDALAAKRALPGAPAQAQEDDVLARARRTDYLLLGAGLAAVGTGVVSYFAWRGASPSRAPDVAAAIVPSPSGVRVALTARFGGP